MKEMRRFSLFFSMVAFFSANLFAADTAISRVIPTKNTADNTERVETTTVKNRSAREVKTTSRGVPRNTPTNTTKTAASTKVVSRSNNARKNSQRATLSDGVNVVGRSARTEAASINNTAALRRAGITLRASTAEVGGRATIGNTGLQTGSNIDEQVRNVHSRASLLGNNKQKQITAESLAEAKDILEKTSDLNSTCQAQYNECMDQFCAVVDANQKRCSCSANLTKYAKAQKAVEEANVELNEVAQRIRYVGLSADEIRAIMSATEAELEMGKTKDNTQTRSMLDDIADMIKDPTSTTTLNSSSTNSLLDMDFDFSSDSSDLFSLDMFSTSNDISSKRGKALYNEAKKRCKNVLNRCKDAGGTENQISGNYDLAIDKDCVAYEQGLNKLNETLKNNVRSANLMLQKARLAVLQSKNEYDTKGCIGALEKCMLDDMVCGENYVKCLDPTKKYIDENGKVVLGKDISKIVGFMTEYDNSKIDSEFIKNSKGDTSCPNSDGACIVNYLMTKIGTGATAKDGGLCRAVLDKCQDRTYVSTGKTSTYNAYNEVVINYVQRAMVNIKAAQAKIISDYASNCMTDVQDCYNQQNSQIASITSNASADSIYKVMKGACYNVALTCGYAVFANDSGFNEPNKIINGISQMFYQSLLCPENSEFSNVIKSEAQDTSRYVNDRCVCNDGYKVSASACVLCSSGEICVNPVVSSGSSSGGGSNSGNGSQSGGTNSGDNGGSQSDENEMSEPISISYKPNGASFSDYDITCNNNCKALTREQATAAGLTRSDYTLIGWSTSSGATAADVGFGDDITSDTNLYAVWSPDPNSCPSNSEFYSTEHEVSPDGTYEGYARPYCKCSNSISYDGSCALRCSSFDYLTQSGSNDCISKQACTSKGWRMFDGSCIQSCPSPNTVGYTTSQGYSACKCADGWVTPLGSINQKCSVQCTGQIINGNCYQQNSYECIGYMNPNGSSRYTTEMCIVTTAGSWIINYTSNPSLSGSSFCSSSSTAKTGSGNGGYCFCNISGGSGWARVASSIQTSTDCAQNCAGACSSLIGGLQTETYQTFDNFIRTIYGQELSCPQNSSVSSGSGDRTEENGWLNWDCKCDINHSYIDNGSCVNSCPVYHMGKRCTSSCGAYYIENNECVSACSTGKVLQGKNCVYPSTSVQIKGQTYTVVVDGAYCMKDLNGTKFVEDVTGGKCDEINSSSFLNGEWAAPGISGGNMEGASSCNSSGSSHTGSGKYCWCKISDATSVLPTPDIEWVANGSYADEATCKTECTNSCFTNSTTNASFIQSYYN